MRQDSLGVQHREQQRTFEVSVEAWSNDSGESCRETRGFRDASPVRGSFSQIERGSSE